jgi:hypothetical protein
VPVRQWVLTLPYRLRYRLAWDHGLTRAVLGIYARVLQDYPGVLAPHARWRSQVVGHGRPASDTGAADASTEAPPPPRRNWTWAALMRRAFGLDVLACPRCGGRLRVIATVEDPLAVRQILGAPRAGEPAGPGSPVPARGGPGHFPDT